MERRRDKVNVRLIYVLEPVNIAQNMTFTKCTSFGRNGAAEEWILHLQSIFQR